VIIKDIEPGSTIWYTSDGVHDVVPEEMLPPERPHQEVYLYEAFRAASSLPSNTPPDLRAQHVLRAVHAWNQTHPQGRHKDDDKAVGYQQIPLAA